MDELSKRFADLVAQYGPGVVEAAKASVQTEMYSYLVSSVVAFGISAVMFAGGRWLMKYKCEDSYDDAIPFATGCVLVGLSAIPLGIGLWQWIDPWTWTALAHPEIYMAHKILHLG